MSELVLCSCVQEVHGENRDQLLRLLERAQHFVALGHSEDGGYRPSQIRWHVSLFTLVTQFLPPQWNAC